MISMHVHQKQQFSLIEDPVGPICLILVPEIRLDLFWIRLSELNL